MPLNTAFLEKVTYPEDSGKITVSFSNQEKIRREFEFLPEIRMPQNRAIDALAREIVSPQTGLVLKRESGRCRILSKSVSALKKAHSLFSLSLNASIPFIEPERQFLLSKNWSYFEEFAFHGEQIKKTETEFSPLGFGETAKKAFLSRMLFLPPGSLPETPRQTSEAMLENAAFKSFQLIYPEKKPRNYSKWIFRGFFELNFSRALLALIPKSNLGFETMDCDCCKPESALEESALPNSLVETEFLEPGYYFDSVMPSFAEKFHSQKPGAAAREKRKREFCLEHHPVGPFYPGQKETIPLADAKKLESENAAKIVRAKELHWACRKRESFLAGEVTRLLAIEEKARDRILEIERAELKKKGLNAFNPCFANPKKEALHDTLIASSELLEALFNGIASPASALSAGAITDAMEAFRGEMLLAFNRKLEANHSEPIYQSAGRAFLRNRDSFTELAIISREIGIPMPFLSR